MPAQLRTRFIVMLVVGLIPSGTLSAAAQNTKRNQLPSGPLVMWREPRDIGSRNLLLGPGGQQMNPDLSRPLVLIKEETGGYSKKYRVKDAGGRVWVAKIGKEAQSETPAVGWFGRSDTRLRSTISSRR